MAIWYVPLFLFALVGIFAGGISRALRGVLLIPMGYFTLLHALFLGSVRYRAPVMPMVCIFAAAGVVAVAKWLGRVQRSRRPAV